MPIPGTTAKAYPAVTASTVPDEDNDDNYEMQTEWYLTPLFGTLPSAKVLSKIEDETACYLEARNDTIRLTDRGFEGAVPLMTRLCAMQIAVSIAAAVGAPIIVSDVRL